MEITVQFSQRLSLRLRRNQPGILNGRPTEMLDIILRDGDEDIGRVTITRDELMDIFKE